MRYSWRPKYKILKDQKKSFRYKNNIKGQMSLGEKKKELSIMPHFEKISWNQNPTKEIFVPLVPLFQNTSDILKMKIKSDLTFLFLHVIR